MHWTRPLSSRSARIARSLASVASLALALALALAACEAPLVVLSRTPRVGNVFVLQEAFGARATAFFVDRSVGVESWVCDDRAEGSCRIETCTWEGPGAPPSPAVSDVGPITISGDASCTTTASSLYPDNTCSLPSISDRFWDVSSGGTVTLTAAGDQVPGFTAALEGPISPTGITVPSSVPSTDDLVLSWTGGSGTMTATGGGSALSALGGTTIVTCEAPASAGTLTIPRSILARFSAVNLPLGVMVMNSETRDIGGYETTLSLATFLGQFTVAPAP